MGGRQGGVAWLGDEVSSWFRGPTFFRHLSVGYFAVMWDAVVRTGACPVAPDTNVPDVLNIVSIMRAVLRLVEDTVARGPVAVFLADLYGDLTDSSRTYVSGFVHIYPL